MDLLERALGPEPDSPDFPPFDAGKIIEPHECEWVEHRAWGNVWVGCRVCHSAAPELVIRGGLNAAHDG